MFLFMGMGDPSNWTLKTVLSVLVTKLWYVNHEYIILLSLCSLVLAQH
jgi:hypothetical protein